MAERIPFAEAISDKLLLKKRFSELSLPQQTALKIFYGLPLETAEELAIWSAFQGKASYDHLGYIDSVEPIPYVPKEYQQAWLILGRRWGKTDSFSSTMIAYEATCGGHEDYIRPGQECVCFLIAQDKEKALSDLPLIRTTLESSPLLKKELTGVGGATSLQLKNGLSIAVSPPVAKTVRGYAVPVIAMDEVGVWYTTSEAANPDYEIERAVKFAQIQFPHFKRIGTSTPWAKEGLLYKYHEAGTEGAKLDPPKRKPYRNILVLHAPTAVSGNPLISRSSLQTEFDQDPEAYEREAMARFTDAISGFLNGSLVRSAVQKDIYERPPKSGVHYVAALDPAFRRDAFGFTIVHNDSEGVVQDVVRRWKAAPGQVINPADVLNEIMILLRAYHVFVAYSDQYHLDSLQQLAIDRGFSIEGVPFTAKSKAAIFGSLQQLINQQKLLLLDSIGLHGDAARETVDELVSLERRNLPGGGVQISAPSSRHDDMATVLALAAHKATWLTPMKPTNTSANRPLTVQEKISNQIKRKRLATNRGLEEVFD